MFLISSHRKISNFINIVSLFPFNKEHSSNIHSAEFSKYSLGPDFLNLAFVTFSFNVKKIDDDCKITQIECPYGP